MWWWWVISPFMIFYAVDLTRLTFCINCYLKKYLLYKESSEMHWYRPSCRWFEWMLNACVTVQLQDDEEVKSVTQQFCDWVASLGGDSNNIDETTITSLFASGYETKPALSVPIHVVELANIPPELRLSTALPPEPLPQPPTTRPRSLGCARVCYGVCEPL